jgi:hypothetical protein
MRHQFWGAGEPECPPELKAPNGELHTTRCKVCGDGWRKTGNLCLTKAAADVLAERQRQIEREGYTTEHDDEHTADDLADAGAAYALVAHFARTGIPAADVWPWEPQSFKPRDQRQNYVRAAALLQAAVERLDRAAARGVNLPDGAKRDA